MAISYEEALVTLQAMFTEPWTRQSLDAVLRHEKGHMENTCDVILQHGEAKTEESALLAAREPLTAGAAPDAMNTPEFLAEVERRLAEKQKALNAASTASKK